MTILDLLTESDATLLQQYQAEYETILAPSPSSPETESDSEEQLAPPLPFPESPEEFAENFRGFSCPIPDFHKQWYSELDTGENCLLLAPRESAKSSVVITYCEYRLVRNRQTRIGYMSKTEGAAKAFVREIKLDFERNTELIRTVGPLRPDRPVVWGTNEFTIAGAMHGKDVSVFAVGITGQLPSRRVDILILDDVETLESVKTPEGRAATRERLAKEAFPMVSPGGQIIIVGTRKHADDLYARVEADNKPRETVADAPLVEKTFRLIFNCTRAILPDGSSYWPEKWSLSDLAAKKRLLDSVNIRSWSSEYMNTIIPPETQMFDPEAWPRYERIPDGCTYFQAWDLAISERTSADFTVCATIAVDSDQNVYIVDIWRRRVTFHETQEKIKELGYLVMPELIGIEATAYQQSAIQEAIRTTQLPIVPMLSAKGRAGSVVALQRQTANTRTIGSDKIARAALIQARSAVGKIWRPAAPVPWWPDFAEELAFFPESTHDDQTDALAYCIGLVLQGATAGEWDRLMKERTPECPGCQSIVFDDRLDLSTELYCPACGTLVREPVPPEPPPQLQGPIETDDPPEELGRWGIPQ